MTYVLVAKERHELRDDGSRGADGRVHRIPADGQPGRRRRGITPRRPASSSFATASRDTNDTPSPARAACLIAPLEPSVSVSTAIPAPARNSSFTRRVPDPGLAQQPAAALELVGPESSCQRRADRPPMSSRTSSFGRIACASMRASRGGRPAIATSASWPRTIASTRSRLPTSSPSPISGCERRERLHQRRNERLGGRRHRGDPQSEPAARLGRVRRAAPLVQEADDVGRVRRELVSGRSRPHAATLALEQVDTDLARQSSDGSRDRWLRDDELGGGGAHRSRAHDREEAPQLRQRDRHPGEA